MLLNLYVFSLVASSCLFVAVESKTKANKINQYLIEKCNTDDFGTNLAAAKELLVECQKKTSTYFNNNAALIKDLNTFISLEQINNGKIQCNGESFKILVANNELVGGNLDKKVQQSAAKFLTRLESLVYTIMLKHAQTCAQIYGKRYEQAKVSSGDESLIIKKAQEATKRTNSVTVVAVPHMERLYAQWLHQDLVRLAKQANDPNAKFAFMVNIPATGKGSADNVKLELIMKKYIVQPCKDFVTTFGPDLFKPAQFDTLLKPDLMRNYLRDGETVYYICRKVLDRQFYKKIFNSMLKLTSDPQLEFKYARMSQERYTNW